MVLHKKIGVDGAKASVLRRGYSQPTVTVTVTVTES